MDVFKTLLVDSPTVLASDGTGLLQASNNLSDVDDTATAVSNLRLEDGGVTQSKFAARAPRQGVTSDGTSNMAVVGSPSAIELGTADVTFGWWVYASDWSPAGSVIYLFSTDDNSTGFQTAIFSDGKLRIVFRNGTSTVYSTAALPVSDGEWAFLAMSLDRTGNALFYCNGEQLGAAVDISANSAKTFTSATTGFYIGGHSVNGGASAATRGECFIYSGLLSASQIAAMQANGTAKNSGLSFVAHWVPSQFLAAGIFEDISGNGNHAALGGVPGTNGIDTVIPVELPQETVKVPALRSDGSNGSRIYATLNDQDPNDGDYLLKIEGIYPQDAGGTVKRMAAFSSSVSDVVQDGCLLISYNSLNSAGQGLYILQCDPASTANYVRLSSPILARRLEEVGAAGVPFVLGLARNDGVMSIFLRIGNGPAIDVTNLFAEDTGSSGAAWSDAISGDYLVLGHDDGSNAAAMDYIDVVQYNAAPDSLAEAADAMSPTPQGAKWLPVGDNSPIYETDFSSGTGWTLATDTAITGGELVFTANGTDRSAYRSDSALAPYVGQKVRFYFDADSTGTVRLVNSSAAAITEEYGLDDISVAAGSNVLEGTILSAGNTTWGFRFRNAGGSVSIDNLVVTVLGQTVGLDLSDGGGFQPKNPRSENGSSHWLTSATGIEHTVKTRAPKFLIATLAASTSPQQILGASCVPTGWEITRVRAKAASGTPTIIIGNVSGGTQVVASVALSTSWQALSIVDGIHITSTANLWATLGSAVAVDLEFELQPRGDL